MIIWTLTIVPHVLAFGVELAQMSYFYMVAQLDPSPFELSVHDLVGSGREGGVGAD